MSFDPCVALASKLTAYGTVGTNIFIGFAPDEVDDCIMLREVPGPGPVIHSVCYDVQVLLRGARAQQDATRAKAENIRNTIWELRPQTIGGVFYGGFNIITDIDRLGLDEQNRPLFSLNVRLLRSRT